MTPANLIARVTEMGGRITLEAGTLNLVKPADPYWRERIVKDLLPLLAEHRAALLAHFQGSSEAGGTDFKSVPEDDPGRHCRKCARTIWVGGLVTGEDVWRTCPVRLKLLPCSYYRKEYAQ